MSLFLYSFRRPLGVALLGFFTFAAPAVSQPVVPGQGGAGAAPAPATSDPSAPGTVCGQRIPEPAAQPPSNLGTILYQVAPCFDAQGNTTLVDIQTYLYYIKLRGSQPSQGNWISYNAATEQRIRDDFKELWGTNFLDNLWIEANDYTFANGVPGKIVVYHIEERQRVKNVDYVGSKLIERSKIEDKLKENDTGIRLDTFIDPALIRKVEGIVRDMMKEKGFQSADVTHEITPASGGPKLVNVTFHLSEGPKVKIQKVEFLGNTAINS
ncbi:MAG: hypothetical protein LBQ09_08930, partial [Acidobacteriaceae bacterium]|nr:hypothetical protein [Acidobacteriaceae bacterium]